MDLTTIEMDPAAARQAFLEYRDSVRRRHDVEEAQIMRGYQALAKGESVIDLVSTIRTGGGRLQPGGWRGAVWVPNLAVMRADQRWCWVSTHSDGRVEYHSKRSYTSRETRNLVALPPGTLPSPSGANTSYGEARAMVPPVPPHHRPAAALGSYHILFEAEWRDVAPEDPALLRHIGGDLYVIVATWDLTELERTVLAGRFR
jgi:hypothetical protein